MICGYNDIYDLCLNKYSYEYLDFIENSSYITVASGDSDRVIRYDLTNNTNEIISISSTSPIHICDNAEEQPIITDWEAYQIYRFYGPGPSGIKLPPLEEYKAAQKKLVEKIYNSTIDRGISFNSGSHTISLAASLSDQLYYRNLITQVEFLYNDDPFNTLPEIIDKNYNVYKFRYEDYNSVFRVYFGTLIYLKNLFDQTIINIDSVSFSDQVSTYTWDPNISLDNSNTITDAVNLVVPEKAFSAQAGNCYAGPYEVGSAYQSINYCTTNEQCGSGKKCCANECVSSQTTELQKPGIFINGDCDFASCAQYGGGWIGSAVNGQCTCTYLCP